MTTYVIPDKLRATVDRMYDGGARDKVIKDLEAGKILYRGGAKLKADRVEKKEKASTPDTPAKTDEKRDKNIKAEVR